MFDIFDKSIVMFKIGKVYVKGIYITDFLVKEN